MAKIDPKAWLEAVAGTVDRVNLNARTAAALVTSTRCNVRRVLDVAAINKASVARDLGFEMPSGQSPFALGRGNQFERRVKRDEYLELIELLRPLGFDGAKADIRDLREEVPFAPRKADEVLTKRAKLTREAIIEIATGHAPPGRIIDGAALAWRIGGMPVRLEADALAWWMNGKLRVVEVKSFPVEWGQIPKEKVISASWQTAVYVAALQDLLVEEGLDPALVSTEIFLVCPRNTGLKPELVKHEVTPQLRLLRQHAGRDVPIAQIAERAGDVTVDVSKLPPSKRQLALRGAIARIGPAYQPSCLSACELAGYCRSCAQEDGDPSVMGGEVLQVAIGMTSLHHAAALLEGAKSKSTDSDFAEFADDVRAAEAKVLG